MYFLTLIAAQGWVVFVSGLHEETSEEDVTERFSDCGAVSSCTIPLDRQTGFVKGYALVEFDKYESARVACQDLNGQNLLGQTIHVDWAFIKGPRGGSKKHHGRGRPSRGRRAS